jgi:hypothetical protein
MPQDGFGNIRVNVPGAANAEDVGTVLRAFGALMSVEGAVRITIEPIPQSAGDDVDPKDDVQTKLSAIAAQCPIGVYVHRKGGEYVVYSHSLDEGTLQPLVHYYSLTKRTRWTRTVADFTEEVDGKPRFARVRPPTHLELYDACGV